MPWQVQYSGTLDTAKAFLADQFKRLSKGAEPEEKLKVMAQKFIENALLPAAAGSNPQTDPVTVNASGSHVTDDEGRAVLKLQITFDTEDLQQ